MLQQTCEVAVVYSLLAYGWTKTQCFNKFSKIIPRMKISALQKWYSKIVENRKSSERGIFTHDGDSKISLRGGSLDHPGHSWYVIAPLYGPIKSNLFQFHSKKKNKWWFCTSVLLLWNVLAHFIIWLAPTFFFFLRFFLSYVLAFWPQSMGDLSSLIRDWTCTPCIGRQCLNH